MAKKPPVLLSYRPRPASTRTSDLPVGPVTVTTIARTWADGDERRCRLCPAGTCSAYKKVCTVLVGHSVPAEMAWTYDASRLAWAGAG
ncbi:hypothetical protein [Singulisphaera sp. PoT]|uniref:hypothetical protein n=1 Tax=Singulisphaera sp. PoT TaxID=3411797 RepID=UPI003BF4DE0B